MPADLFEGAREIQRERLRDLGWFQPSSQFGTLAVWRDPEGGTFTEEEAFRWLARREAGQSKVGE